MLRARSFRRPGPWLALVIAVTLPGRAAAQQIAWRSDYNAARREATATGKPILIDFYTENCLWCRRLDASTFRDPTVAAQLAERFVALRIDAERESQLAAALRVSSYPTVVIAAADGKILGVIEGFVEAPKMAEQLARASVVSNDPDWMVKDFQEAAKAITASDYGRAIALLKSVAADGQGRSVQVKARSVLRDLEGQAATQLARAKQSCDRNQPVEAAAQLAELMRTYAGTSAASDAATLLVAVAARPELRDGQRLRRAQELLAQAREEFRGNALSACLDRCDALTAGYSDLPEGDEAAKLAGQIKASPEMLGQIAEELNRRSTAVHLALADSYLKKGQAERAQACLERVIRDAPGTSQAQLASARIAQIGGTGTQQTNFKK